MAHYGPVAVAVCTTEDARLSAYPNPSSRTVELRIAVPSEAPVTITVHDALGRALSAQQSTTLGGIPQHRMDMSELPRGTYHSVVRAMDGTVNGRTVMVKEH